jgi:hypothetical protein
VHRSQFEKQTGAPFGRRIKAGVPVNRVATLPRQLVRRARRAEQDGRQRFHRPGDSTSSDVVVIPHSKDRGEQAREPPVEIGLAKLVHVSHALAVRANDAALP